MNDPIYILGPVTSLLMWRAVMMGAVPDPGRECVDLDMTRTRASVRAIKRLEHVEALGSVPLDSIVGDPRNTHSCAGLDTIVLRREMPSGSFCSMGDGSYICSPALCLALLGRGGMTPHLLELGCELCGKYAMTYRTDGAYCKCSNLATVSGVSEYIGRLGKRHGIQVARRMVQLIADESGSPRETSVFLSFTLPYQQGGYGLPRPILNGKVYISRQSQEALGKQYLKIDLLYKDEKGKPIAGAEYDSDERHLYTEGIVDVKKIIADDERREVIRDEGIDLVTIRTDDTRRFERYDAKVMRMGKLIGCEPHPSKGKLADRRKDLTSNLFDAFKWEHEYELLRKMAGYERTICHPRGRGSA